MKLNNFCIISLISLMIFMTSFSMVYAEDISANETIITDNNELSLVDENNEILGDGTGFDFNDIQTKVDSDNDTIQLEEGNYISNGKTIVIKKSITIDGSSSTLDAKGLSDVFYIQKGNSVTLKNMNIVNSKITAIFADNANLNIINCTFSRNNGVLNSIGSNIFITDSEFKNNNIMEDYYYIVTTSFSTLKVTYSNFTDNAAGICYNGNLYDTKCMIDSCNFINNGGMYGGALRLSGGVVNNSLFENNEYAYGAAIVSYVDLIVENSRFINNIANDGGSIIHFGQMSSEGYEGILKVINSTFINSTASRFGNAIYAYCSDVELINSTISSRENHISNIYIKIGNLTNENSNVTPNNIRVLSVIPAKFIGKKLTVRYNSGKYYSVRLLESEDQTECNDAKVSIKIYKGNKLTESFTKEVDGFGYVKFKVNPKWGIGKFKVVIHQTDIHYEVKDFVSYITVKKAKTTVKAKNTKSRFKKSKYYKITIKNKASKKPVSKLKIKVKVYTKGKYKTYSLKTNKKGIAKFNMKNLKRGNHKVKILSRDKKYTVSKTSRIRIR